MKTREQVSVSVAGHEIKMEIDPDEVEHIERASKQVNDRLRTLGERAPAASPAKLLAMVAFQFACDLSIANELLDEAEELHAEVKRQKEAVGRLENLLAKVDDALMV